MGRTREFDRDVVLGKAIEVFAEHGYEGTSTEQLLEAMNLGRQSLYNAFGDKRALYLEALKRYSTESVGAYVRALNTASSPLAGIEAVIIGFAAKHAMEGAVGCLGVGAICEFGRGDAEVSASTDVTSHVLLDAFTRRLVDAKALGEVAAELDAGDAARFLLTTLTGMKVTARAGASAKVLRGIATMALRSLR